MHDRSQSILPSTPFQILSATTPRMTGGCCPPGCRSQGFLALSRMFAIGSTGRSTAPSCSCHPSRIPLRGCILHDSWSICACGTFCWVGSCWGGLEGCGDDDRGGRARRALNALRLTGIWESDQHGIGGRGIIPGSFHKIPQYNNKPTKIITTAPRKNSQIPRDPRYCVPPCD